MANTIMTKAQALKAILAVMADNEGVVEYATNELNALTRKAEESARKRAEKNSAYDPIKAEIVEILTANTEGMRVGDIMANLSTPMTSQKVTYLLTTMRESAEVTRKIVKGVSYYSVN